MRRFLFIIYSVIVCVMLNACHDDVVTGSQHPEVSINGNIITVRGSIIVPEMVSMVSRGDAGSTSGADLKLTVLEFDKNDDPELSILTNVYEARVTSRTDVRDETEVNFEVDLVATSDAKTLQFMVTTDEIWIDNGSMASVLPNVAVGSWFDKTTDEAYWGERPFEDGYCSVDKDGKVSLIPGIAEEFKSIPVIRNFASVSVEVSQDVNNFELKGFELINVPSRGTVAPWNMENQCVPVLLDANDKMKSYSAIAKEYSGITADGGLYNTEMEARYWIVEDDDEPEMINMLDLSDPIDPGEDKVFSSLEPKYIYEHPYESTRRTYMIVYGIYKSGNTEVKGFYKIDIGKSDKNNGTFDYYSIIRNINYKVLITEVTAQGAPTVSDAIDHVPFNNLIASTETSGMLEVSDNVNMLVVNATSHVIVTDDKPIEILYRYVTNVTSDNPGVDNSIPKPIISKGAVIKEYTEEEPYTKDGVSWMRILITPQTPTGVLQRQSITITDGKALSRRINLMLRTPWRYEYLESGNTARITVAPGLNNEYSSVEPQPISASSGQPFTVYFNLPDKLPQSMFPLQFQIESKGQIMENNKAASQIVYTGESLFNPQLLAISYLKTVTYEEYMYKYSVDNPDQLDVNEPNERHTVRCRFTTITSSTESDSIKVHNSYFSPDVSVRVTR